MDVRTMIRIVRFGFAVVVFSALFFGAQTVWGSTTVESACLWHPPTFLGTCSNQLECQGLCDQYNPEPWVAGECRDGCCPCLT